MPTKEVKTWSGGTPDRVSFSLGGKINLGNYENVDINFSYQTDVKPEERPEDAMARVIKFVESHFEEKHEEVMKFMEEKDG